MMVLQDSIINQKRGLSIHCKVRSAHLSKSTMSREMQLFL